MDVDALLPCLPQAFCCEKTPASAKSWRFLCKLWPWAQHSFHAAHFTLTVAA